MILLPATNVPTIQEVPDATRNWPFAVGAVEVPVPPLDIASGCVSASEVKLGVVVTFNVTFPVSAPPPVRFVPAMTCVPLEKK